MGRAAARWDQLTAAMEAVDDGALTDAYADDAIYLEPQNPPHEGVKLIVAYLNSWLQAREGLDVTTRRLLESDDESTIAVEWSLSYTAGGRRWSLNRCSWLEVDSDDRIVYHHDYY